MTGSDLKELMTYAYESYGSMPIKQIPAYVEVELPKRIKKFNCLDKFRVDIKKDIDTFELYIVNETSNRQVGGELKIQKNDELLICLVDVLISKVIEDTIDRDRTPNLRDMSEEEFNKWSNKERIKLDKLLKDAKLDDNE